jgi:hypothetical protein
LVFRLLRKPGAKSLVISGGELRSQSVFSVVEQVVAGWGSKRTNAGFVNQRANAVFLGGLKNGVLTIFAGTRCRLASIVISNSIGVASA